MMVIEYPGSGKYRTPMGIKTGREVVEEGLKRREAKREPVPVQAPPDVSKATLVSTKEVRNIGEVPTSTVSLYKTPTGYIQEIITGRDVIYAVGKGTYGTEQAQIEGRWRGTVKGQGYSYIDRATGKGYEVSPSGQVREVIPKVSMTVQSKQIVQQRQQLPLQPSKIYLGEDRQKELDLAKQDYQKGKISTKKYEAETKAINDYYKYGTTTQISRIPRKVGTLSFEGEPKPRKTEAGIEYTRKRDWLEQAKVKNSLKDFGVSSKDITKTGEESKIIYQKPTGTYKGTPQHEKAYKYPKGIYQGYGFKEGKIAWAKNRKFTEEHCKNIGLVRKGKHVSPNTEFKKGQHPSRETEFKIGDLKVKERLRKLRMEGKIITPKFDTSIERKIQNYLKLLHIDFLTHNYMSEITHAYQCDIIIPSSKTIIETDGCYWHGCPICNKKLNEWQIKTIELDNFRTKELQEKGYRVIRLREHDIKVMGLNKFQEVLQ